jgi:hypothetical protein
MKIGYFVEMPISTVVLSKVPTIYSDTSYLNFSGSKNFLLISRLQLEADATLCQAVCTGWQAADPAVCIMGFSLCLSEQI